MADLGGIQQAFEEILGSFGYGGQRLRGRRIDWEVQRHLDRTLENFPNAVGFCLEAFLKKIHHVPLECYSASEHLCVKGRCETNQGPQVEDSVEGNAFEQGGWNEVRPAA